MFIDEFVFESVVCQSGGHLVPTSMCEKKVLSGDAHTAQQAMFVMWLMGKTLVQTFVTCLLMYKILAVFSQACFYEKGEMNCQTRVLNAHQLKWYWNTFPDNRTSNVCFQSALVSLLHIVPVTY